MTTDLTRLREAVEAKARDCQAICDARAKLAVDYVEDPKRKASNQHERANVVADFLASDGKLVAQSAQLEGELKMHENNYYRALQEESERRTRRSERWNWILGLLTLFAVAGSLAVATLEYRIHAYESKRQHDLPVGK
jgi:hypothetical protein